MFRKAIVHFLVLFLIVGFVGLIGCGDDGETPPPTPTEPTPTEPTPQVLAQANNVVVPHGDQTDVAFTVTSQVVIKGTVTWTSPPDTLVALFYQDTTMKSGGTGGSPLTITHTVTAAEVAASPNWRLRITNSSATHPATVNVTVQTVP